jgi:hypothetical protein
VTGGEFLCEIIIFRAICFTTTFFFSAFETNKQSSKKKKEGIDTTTAKWERLMATAEEE